MTETVNIRLCRLCLLEKNSYIALYEPCEQYGFVIADALNELLELDVNPNDGLPGCICCDCTEEVARFKTFKKVCHDSKRKLKCEIMHSSYELDVSEEQTHLNVKMEPLEIETGKWSQKLLEKMMENDTTSVARRSAHEYLDNLPSGCTTLVDGGVKHSVEPFEAVDCVVGAFGFELDCRAKIRSSSCLQYPLRRQIKLEDDRIQEIKYRHRCSICSKLFADQVSLRNHMELKSCAIPMPCRMCPKTFFGKRRLQKHVYNCHRSDSLYQCHVCQRKFSKKDHLNRHMSTHSHERPFSCPQCHRSYKGERQLECHMFNFHKVRKRENFPCDLCGKLFVRKETLDSHVCSEPRTFVCDSCGLSYGQKHELKQHVWRVHLNHLPHKCTTCRKDFATVSELNQHAVVHQVDRPFECPKCGNCFKTPRHLKQHAAMCLSERKVRGCYVCGATFTSEEELSEHKQVHAREGRFSCSLCVNTYKKSSYLNQHMKRCHLADKAYSCIDCGKTFAVKSDLRQHSMVHSELRPFACEVCGKSYKHKQALQRHVATSHLSEEIAQVMYM